jgi:poly(A) polymerase
MREMLQLQSRFERTRGARAMAFLESKRFRAAFDLLVLRARAGNADPALAHFWTTLQALPPEQRRRELGLGNAKAGSNVRRRRRRRGRREADGAPEQLSPV